MKLQIATVGGSDCGSGNITSDGGINNSCKSFNQWTVTGREFRVITCIIFISVLLHLFSTNILSELSICKCF